MSAAFALPSTTDAVSELQAVGSTVLRGAWNPAALGVLREAIVQYAQQRAERIAAGGAQRNDRMYHTHGTGTFAALVRDGLLEMDFLRDLFVGTAYHELCAAYLGSDELYVEPKRLAFRLHDPRRSNRSFVPYHQDSGSQNDQVRDVLNCWIPLDPGCGRDAPGLEVVRAIVEPGFPLKDFGQYSESAAYDFLTIDRDRVAESYGDRLMAPTFEVGDGLVFSQDVIHRTYVTPEMTQPRINFEYRVFSPNGPAPGASADDVREIGYRVA
jgi:hypothetical protein